MIRINLLPVRAAKKKESIRVQLTIAGGVTVIVLIAIGVFYFLVSSEATTLSVRIAESEQEINMLKAKIGELSKIKEQKRVVEEKLKIVNDLEAARTGPSDLFEKISGAVPERAWITKWDDTGAVLTLTGYAETDETVAEFMRRLEKANPWKVELDIAKREIERETGADVVNFIIRLERGVNAGKGAQTEKGAQK